jgi:hypothetical protein
MGVSQMKPLEVCAVVDIASYQHGLESSVYGRSGEWGI